MRSFYPPICLLGVCVNEPTVLFKRGEERAIADPDDLVYHKKLLKKGFVLTDEDPNATMVCNRFIDGEDYNCKCEKAPPWLKSLWERHLIDDHVIDEQGNVLHYLDKDGKVLDENS
jgi:hypothetical protein